MITKKIIYLYDQEIYVHLHSDASPPPCSIEFHKTCAWIEGYNQGGTHLVASMEECQAQCCSDPLCKSFDYRLPGSHNYNCAVSHSNKHEVGSAYKVKILFCRSSSWGYIQVTRPVATTAALATTTSTTAMVTTTTTTTATAVMDSGDFCMDDTCLEMDVNYPYNDIEDIVSISAKDCSCACEAEPLCQVWVWAGRK